MDMNEYERFCSENINGSFTQSSCWTRVKDNWKNEYIVAKDKNGNTVGTMLILVKKIPLLKTAMLYAPRGPVCDFHDRNALKLIFEQVKLIAKKHKAYTLKIDPLIDENDFEAIANLRSLGFIYHGEKVGYDNIQCRENYRIELNGRTAEEVFQSFKPKWRYNIRLAERKGVRCKFCGKEGLDDFERLMKQTSNRDGFDMRTKEYFARILDAFGDSAGLCMCCYDEVPLSGALYIDYADTVSYVYGCSSDNLRNLMPNYLMQWNMIRYAADRGRRVYDFCGVPYWYDETHRNYGVYRFKQGFNGEVKTWAGEFDYTFKSATNFCADLMMKARKFLL